MVRLRVLSLIGVLVFIAIFQFLNGTIKSFERKVLWAFLKEFQFLNGTIKSAVVGSNKLPY